MKAFKTLATACVALFSTVAVAASDSTAASAATTVDPIVIKGTKFFYKTNGTQFYIRGVAYQQDYSGNGTFDTSSTNSYTDPIADGSRCLADIPYLVQLNTNVIRVYALDPTKGHDTCMNALAAAGIYVIADLSAPGQSINRASPSWNDDLYARYTAVVDAMAGYTNTMGFFAGNEVTNNSTNTDASAFVKAAVRDTKSYIKSKNYRTIGVGYATSDDATIRDDVADYFNCGSSSDSVDFYGYNIYSWCGDSSYTTSGYDERTAFFQNFSIPVFFAEYGCNTVQPRTFTDVSVLYGPQMTPVWSGGIVYMYFQETNDYGLVTVSGNSVSTLQDFSYLSAQLATISPSSINSASYTPTNTVAQSCPTVGAEWAAASSLPPTPNQQLCTCMYNALSCVPNNVATSGYGSLFGEVCGLGPAAVCAGITANSTSGTYGAYSGCNGTEQLGWVLNAYYLAQNSQNRASACNFGGSATLKSASSPTGSCSSLIAQAGPQGTGTVTSAPSSSGKTSSGASGSKGAASPMGAPSMVVFGTTAAIASYIGLAFVSGMAMIFL